jgi:hypothetical protein
MVTLIRVAKKGNPRITFVNPAWLKKKFLSLFCKVLNHREKHIGLFCPSARKIFIPGLNTWEYNPLIQVSANQSLVFNRIRYWNCEKKLQKKCQNIQIVLFLHCK